MEQLSINGLAVERQPGPGTRILFVHGSSGGSWYWHGFMGHFAALGYDCYAVNLRGHPPSPPVEELGRVTLQDYVEDVRGALQELGEVILVGHSMGGAIAQVLAQSMPLKAAVFASSAPVAGVKFQNPPFNLWFLLYGLKSIPAMVRKRTIRPGFRVARSALLNRVEPGRQRELWQKLCPESATVAVEVLKGTVGADLSRVPFPLLTAGGREDRTTVIDMQREIARFHGTDFLELDDHGHMFMIEPGWERCAARLADWLASRGCGP
ncbi:MAG: alpha/beta hydrolase [Ectothiorhodospiraceae bacterium]|nr:alpha/beta hydrolase [Ectothiorhodospiraceae bacterium]